MNRRGRRLLLALLLLIVGLDVIESAPTGAAAADDVLIGGSQAASTGVGPGTSAGTVSTFGSSPVPSWPTSVSPDGHAVLDQSGDRWQLFGDVAWHLATVSPADVRTYLDGVAAKGFTSVLTMIPNNMWTAAPNNYAGQAPWVGTAFKSSINETYWAHVDWLLAEAANRGITLWMAPAYTGNQGEGWYNELVAASAAQVLAYGSFLGARYKNQPNIVWVLGGDLEFYEGTPIHDRYRSLATGLANAGDLHLVTGHPGSDKRTSEQWDDSETYVDLNGVYENNDAAPAIADVVGAGWSDSPTRPLLYLEPSYEQEGWRGHTTTAQELRHQSWAAFGVGAIGSFLGNNPRWHFEDGGWFGYQGTWKESLDDVGGALDKGSVQYGILVDVVSSLGWAGTAPDTTDTFLVAGEGAGSTRAVARFSHDRALVYMPTARNVTLDLTELAAAGGTVAVSKIDPASGAKTPVGTFATSAPRQIGGLGGNADGSTDWVIVVEATVVPPASGRLRVTTNPPVPSRIFVDGVPRNDWGLDWLGLPAGSHDVCFSDVPGFTTPPCTTIQVLAQQTTAIEGVFDRLGLLKVEVTPAGVPSTIFVDGLPREEYGLFAFFEPGIHKVCWGDVDRFAAPGCANVTVQAGNQTTVSGAFTPASSAPPGPAPAIGPHGYLRVTTTPAVASRLVIDGTPRSDWALTWMKFPVGQHELCFTDVPGFTAPVCRQLTITDGATVTVAGVFQALGLLSVKVQPAGLPVDIVVNGDPRNQFGMYAWMESGTYQVCGTSIAKFTTPSCTSGNVSAGGLTEVTLAYSATTN